MGRHNVSYNLSRRNEVKGSLRSGCAGWSIPGVDKMIDNLFCIWLLNMILNGIVVGRGTYDMMFEVDSAEREDAVVASLFVPWTDDWVIVAPIYGVGLFYCRYFIRTVPGV